MNTSLKKETNYQKIIGITGGIGSGKSTISKILIHLGYPVFNADNAAKQIINSDNEAIKSIKNNFGEIYPNDILDTKKLANLVFNNKKALQQLNAIIHPKVSLAFKNWLLKHKSSKFVFKEAAILIETGGYKKLDGLILIVADKLTRINRIKQRDNISEEDIASRIKNQLPDKEKIPLADFVILNNTENMILPQVLEVLSQIENK